MIRLPNRTLCQVLDEMRMLDKTRNYAMLLSLVEEVQMMGNRMESALWDQKDINSLQEKITNLKTEIKQLKKHRDKLKGK